MDHIARRDRTDPYRWLRDETDRHRTQHRCWAYPFSDGTMLGAVTTALEPRTVLELGTALGYTACWWARNGAHVDTLDNDPMHVQLARHHLLRAPVAGRVVVQQADFDLVHDRRPGGYDVVFFDGYDPPADPLEHYAARLSPQGVLIITNLNLDTGRSRHALRDRPGWITQITGDNLAICLRN